jgi:REP element-mobilizing transposase RayT
VTLRVRSEVPNLRKPTTGRAIFAAFARARERHGVRLTHFSVQANHVHLIVEAKDRTSLSRAMQGLGVRLAVRLNRALQRRGAIFADRYHARALRTPAEVRRVVLYVMNNYRRHLAQVGAWAPGDWADPYSSVDYFDGFRRIPAGEGEGRRPCAEFSLGRAPPVVAPRSWLLRAGWRRCGLLTVSECPWLRLDARPRP